MPRNGHGGLYKAPAMEARRGRLRGEGDEIKFIDLRFERWQVVGLGEEQRGKAFHELLVLGMNHEMLCSATMEIL